MFVLAQHFFCSVCLRERKNLSSTPVQPFTHYQEAVGRIHAPETVKSLSARHEVHNHELMCFHMTTIGVQFLAQNRGKP
jgi:hypothetical protein